MILDSPNIIYTQGCLSEMHFKGLRGHNCVQFAYRP